MSVIGIIGGTGLSSIDQWVSTRSEFVDTDYGAPSAPLSIGEWGSHQVCFLPRHGTDHSVPPHKVNYRANISALKNAGARSVIAIAAVGGISAEATPGSLVIPNQLIDYTYGREHTFFDGLDNSLNHVDFTDPYTQELRINLVEAARKQHIDIVDRGIYGATQGPRLETAAEIKRMERDGCSIVGMTGMPEAGLARELDLDYACCAIVVNWAAGQSNDKITMDLIRGFVAAGQEKLAVLFESFFSAR